MQGRGISSVLVLREESLPSVGYKPLFGLWEGDQAANLLLVQNFSCKSSWIHQYFHCKNISDDTQKCLLCFHHIPEGSTILQLDVKNNTRLFFINVGRLFIGITVMMLVLITLENWCPRAIPVVKWLLFPSQVQPMFLWCHQTVLCHRFLCLPVTYLR